jgi:flagellar biosynthetic protein FliR
MEILEWMPLISDNFITFMLIFSRIMALLITFMLFRREIVTVRVILALGSLLTLYVMLLYPNQKISLDNSVTLFYQLFIQTGIGLLSAFILNLILEIFIITGQIISTQIGLSITSLIDPTYGSITSLTNFYYITAILVFFTINGHLFLIKFMIDNFLYLPINALTISHHSLMDLAKFANIIFYDSLMLSMTIITVVLVTNIGLAVMTRFAPQLNLFSIGINLQIVVGLILVYATYAIFVNKALLLLIISMRMAG